MLGSRETPTGENEEKEDEVLFNLSLVRMPYIDTLFII